ncbi:MAG TPA: sulfite exporter TauE/SafE family protein [Thiolinea sp.]|nr:sulfite exporter TauE/SafE family protein [Thiolinea sp.]
MSDWLSFTLFILAGGLAGFINVMAGGGSALTVPMLVLMGYDPTVANGSNRIAILVEAVVGVAAFRKHQYSDFAMSWKLGLMTLPGAILGAIYAVRVDDALFMKLLGLVMILVILSLLLPKARVMEHARTHRWANGLRWPAMFLIGFYGGFIQAGVGFMIMAGLTHLYQMDLVRVNMHKVFITLLFTLPAVILFIWTGNINWFAAIGLSVGMSLGAWLAVKASIRKGERLVRIMLMVALGMVAIKLLFF